MQSYKHSKSTLAEGVSLLFWFGLIAIVGGCFQIALSRSVWAESRLIVLGVLALEIAIGATVLWLAIGKIRRNEMFLCILEDDVIECICPLAERGDSFKLKLTDLVRLEQDGTGPTRRWYLHDRQGNRYWLTDAYRNPADKFIRRLQKLNPKLAVTGGQDKEPL